VTCGRSPAVCICGQHALLVVWAAALQTGVMRLLFEARLMTFASEGDQMVGARGWCTGG